MKLLRGLAACTAVLALTACVAAPDLLEQNNSGATPTVARQLLIVVDGKIFGAPLFGTEGHAYLSGLGTGLKGALGSVPSRVVDVDPMMFGNPVLPALESSRPSHIVRVFTVSDTQRQGFPISAVWQMDVSRVAISTIPPADGKPAGTRFKTTGIYKARAEGDTCLESDDLAMKCGEAMGKLLGESMLAAHVVQVDTGN
jgi:hypothetical protein